MLYKPIDTRMRSNGKLHSQEIHSRRTLPPKLEILSQRILPPKLEILSQRTLPPKLEILQL